MAPKLSEDDIDDIIYFARAGEVADLNESLATLSTHEGVSPAEVIIAARDEGKSTCLHMATGNGNIGRHPAPHIHQLYHHLSLVTHPQHTHITNKHPQKSSRSSSATSQTAQRRRSRPCWTRRTSSATRGCTGRRWGATWNWSSCSSPRGRRPPSPTTRTTCRWTRRASARSTTSWTSSWRRWRSSSPRMRTAGSRRLPQGWRLVGAVAMGMGRRRSS